METLKTIIENIVKDHLGLSDEYTDGTYLYHLTRVKAGFSVGTVTIDDFEEIDLKFSDDLVDRIVEAVEKKLSLEALL